MRSILLFAFLAVAVAACGKKPDNSTQQILQPAPAPEAATQDSAQSQAASAQLPDTSQANVDAVIADLTQKVRKYAMEKQRVPTDLSELVAGGYLAGIPQAPAGKKFAIDRKLQVYLAD